MMTIGIDLASEPDRTAWVVRAAGETAWQFHYDAPESERVLFRTPAHEERVEAALQDRVRTHADRQGPCVTAEEASSTEAMLRAHLAGVLRGDWSRWDGSHWQHFSWRDVMLAPPLPSECLARRMGLGPRKYDGPCGLHPNLRAVSIGRAGWMLELEGAPR